MKKIQLNLLIFVFDFIDTCQSHSLFKISLIQISLELIKINSFLMLQSQRQTSTIHYQQKEYQSSNNDQLAKKKHIKKDKDSNSNNNKLTKEQKIRLQKQKNRQAAQRSRDQHRQYVSNLQREILELKEQLQVNRHFCYKCKQTLTSKEMFEDNIISHHIPILNEQFLGNEQQLHEEKSEQIPSIQSQPDYLIRIANENDDSSYLKMILFVSMIVVTILVFSSSSGQEDHARHLLERYTPPTSKPFVSDDFSIISSQNSHDQHRPSIDLNNSLVVRNSILNQQCLHSLIQQRSYSLANLRTSHPSINQVNEGILLCSFQQQKQDPSFSNNEQKSTFLRLFLLGTQIKQMVTTHSSIKNFIQNNIQLNGIYRIAAEIKQVELISHHNCLL